jgi:biopolymer transport protein ExbD
MAYARRSRARKHPAVELNITAFMNLMVVLVPFLLMTAVFTHLAILELNLPAADSSNTNSKDKPNFELRLIIRSDALILSDNKGGLIKRIVATDKGYNYTLLTEFLKQVKARLQEENRDTSSITILSEANTSYDTLVQVMDASRSFHLFQDGEIITAELFPDISIGDAPKE